MSPMVAFEPGSTTRSASPGRARPGSTNCTSTPGLGHQRVQIVEVGDPREHRDRDPEHGVGPGLRVAATATESSAGNRPARSNQGTTRDTQARLAADDLDPGVEQPDVAAEPIDDVGGHPGALGGRQQRHGSDEARDDPAPVDVAHQRHRHVGDFGEAHVGDVPGAQVHLRRTARAFHQDQIGIPSQPLERFQDPREQPGLEPVILPGPGIAPDLALHHQLGARVGLRLEQHRIHVARGRYPARPRLQRLRASDLTPVRGHRALFDMFCGLKGRTRRPRRV